jgi:hypothetical protein
LSERQIFPQLRSPFRLYGKIDECGLERLRDILMLLWSKKIAKIMQPGLKTAFLVVLMVSL